MWKIPNLASALAILTVFTCYVDTWAAPRPPKPVKQSNPHPTSEYDTVHMKEPPEIGIVPTYSGKGAKFDNGLAYPNLKSTICYTLRYHIKEPQSTVHEWYCSSLPSYGWTINPQQLTETQIIARHKKVPATLAVYVDKSIAPGFKTDLLVRYREARR